ncbi:MAG: hypothetical protein JST30_00820 [Armatimonadetes bacterium]|nr:hypothetical protein [Armatimonadota bacterium]
MKLSPISIFVIGLSLAVIAAMVTLTNFLPNVEEAKYQNELANRYIEQAGKQKQANDKVKKAEQDVQKMELEWQKIVAVKTPPNNVGSGGINLAVNRWQLTNDSVKFRNSVQNAVNAQLRRGGVRVVNGPRIPSPPGNAAQIVEYYNYPAIRFPVLVFNLGAVTVTGSYAQIMSHVRAWSSMPNYLAVADGLQLSGTTPTMTGTYNLTLVAYIRGTEVAPTVPESTGAGGGQAPGGNAPSPTGPKPGGR